jgi:hypothetical protein
VGRRDERSVVSMEPQQEGLYTLARRCAIDPMVALRTE